MSLTGWLGSGSAVLGATLAAVVFYYRWRLSSAESRSERARRDLADELSGLHDLLAARDQRVSDLEDQLQRSEVASMLRAADLDRLRAEARACRTPDGAAERLNAALRRISTLVVLATLISCGGKTPAAAVEPRPPADCLSAPNVPAEPVLPDVVAGAAIPVERGGDILSCFPSAASDALADYLDDVRNYQEQVRVACGKR